MPWWVWTDVLLKLSSSKQTCFVHQTLCWAVQMHWTKAPCAQRLGEHHTRVRGSSVGVFVTGTHISEVDKILSDGAAAAPLPSLFPDGSGQENAGS